MARVGAIVKKHVYYFVAVNKVTKVTKAPSDSNFLDVQGTKQQQQQTM